MIHPIPTEPKKEQKLTHTQKLQEQKCQLGSNLKSIWLLVTIAMISVLCLCHHKVVAAEDCQVDMRGIQIECMYYMNKGDPSLKDPNDRCCNVIGGLNLPCICRNLYQKLCMLLLPQHPLFIIFIFLIVLICYLSVLCLFGMCHCNVVAISFHKLQALQPHRKKERKTRIYM